MENSLIIIVQDEYLEFIEMLSEIFKKIMLKLMIYKSSITVIYFVRFNSEI